MSLSPPGSPNGATKRRKAPISTSTILLLIFSNGISFLGGAFYASNAAISTTLQQQQQQRLPQQQQNCPVCPPAQDCPESSCPECPPPKECPKQESSSSLFARQQQEISLKGGRNSKGYLPEMVNRFAYAMAHTSQENFTKTFDLGVPIDYPEKEGDKGVLILYSNEKSMPNNRRRSLKQTVELLSPEEATENCHHMNVVLTNHDGRRQQCVAIVPQYESYHIQSESRIIVFGMK